ncbi:MAG: hypothetical protein HGA27_03350 [Peptococcaceae bacterium]|nr:hypothetical protein [Peptococcaceae bacterium]
MLGQEAIPELDNQLKQTIKFSVYILAVACLFLGFDPRDGVLWGLIIGIIVGIYNSITLVKRIKYLPKLNPESAQKFMKVRFVFRMGLIMAVLFFLGRRLPFVSLLGVGAGILIPYYVSFSISVVETFKLYQDSRALRKLKS